MSRFFTVALLLLVFFFGGMTYGSFEKERFKTETPDIETKTEEMMTEEEVTAEITSAISGSSPKVEESDYFVHRTASFFEKIVTAVYEGIIVVLYQIANLFFE